VLELVEHCDANKSYNLHFLNISFFDADADKRTIKRTRTEILQEILEEKKLRRKSLEDYHKRKLSLLQKLVDHTLEKKDH